MRARSNGGGAARRPGVEPAILIVEGGASLRSALRDLVHQAFPRCAVHEAADCAQAVEKAVALTPRLVLVDSHLPDGDGIALAALIRATQRRADVIVMSSLDCSLFADRSLAEGARAFICKDRLPRELVPALARVLGAPRRGYEDLASG